MFFDIPHQTYIKDYSGISPGFYQPSIRDEILHGWEAVDIMHVWSTGQIFHKADTESGSFPLDSRDRHTYFLNTGRYRSNTGVGGRISSCPPVEV